MTDTTPGPKPPAVLAALRDAIASMPPIGKDSVNREQGFRFRSIEDVMPHARKAMTEHGLVLIPEIVAREIEKRTTARGAVIHTVHLHLRLTIASVADGSTLTASAWGEGADMGDKATSKAMTMALKSALLALLMVADHDDPDATTMEHTVHTPDHRPARRAAKSPEAQLAEQLGIVSREDKAAVKAWADAAGVPVAEVLEAIRIGVLAFEGGALVEVQS